MKFNNEIKVGDHIISKSSKTFIIAEAGVNHNGNLDLAKQLVDVACDAQADAVKFQTFKADHLILKEVKKAPYQRHTTASDESQYDMLRQLEFSIDDLRKIQTYARKRNMLVLTTPFEEYSLERLDDLHLPAYKIASTDLTNVRFLKKVAAKHKPIFLSTGMSYMEEVEIALDTLASINKDVMVLQCTANYPIKDDEANLNIIKTFASRFDMIVGYSDHTTGTDTGACAVAAGARVIEKHFTLDRSMKGPDHKASLDPQRLREYVQNIRRAEVYLGSCIKMPTLSELQTRISLQKYLVTAGAMKKGVKIEYRDVVAKRTGGYGISALYVNDVIGTKAVKNYKKDEIIEV